MQESLHDIRVGLNAGMRCAHLQSRALVNVAAVAREDCACCCCSLTVKGRRPLAKDAELDYEVMSDEEWEEEPEGENLSVGLIVMSYRCQALCLPVFVGPRARGNIRNMMFKILFNAWHKRGKGSLRPMPSSPAALECSLEAAQASVMFKNKCWPRPLGQKSMSVGHTGR